MVGFQRGPGSRKTWWVIRGRDRESKEGPEVLKCLITSAMNEA